MPSANQKMKIPVSVFCLIFWSNIAVSENLTDKISRYSDNDEFAAKVTMEESCTKSDRANYELLDLAKKVNASLDQDITERKPLSFNSEKALKELENFNHKELQKLESECTNARSNYGRILKVREHAAVAAEKIDTEQKERAKNNQIQPTTTNCTSNVSGQTVYTRCNSY